MNTSTCITFVSLASAQSVRSAGDVLAFQSISQAPTVRRTPSATRTRLATVVLAIGWVLGAVEGLAHADETTSVDGREVSTFTAHAAHAVSAAPVASVSHVQVCDARMLTCGAPVALQGSADKVSR